MAGEIEATITAINIAISEKAKRIFIYHTFEGISKWCTGEWNPKTEITKQYKKDYNRLKKKIEIEFIWSSYYSGHRNNKRAKELAKKAVGFKGPKENIYKK